MPWPCNSEIKAFIVVRIAQFRIELVVVDDVVPGHAFLWGTGVQLRTARLSQRLRPLRPFP